MLSMAFLQAKINDPALYDGGKKVFDCINEKIIRLIELNAAYKNNENNQLLCPMPSIQPPYWDLPGMFSYTEMKMNC
jgi:hypothetical protein